MAVTLASLTKNLDKQVTKIMSRAAVRAVDRAMISARRYIVDKIRSVLNVRAKAVNELIVIRKAGGGDDGKVTGSLELKDRPFRLVEFQPRARRVRTTRGPRTGVTVQVKQARKLVGGGFLATMPSGHTGIYKRVPNTRMPSKKNQNKEKIVELFSTRPTDLLGEDSSFMKETEEYASQRFEVEFEREFAFYAQKEFGG